MQDTKRHAPSTLEWKAGEYCDELGQSAGTGQCHGSPVKEDCMVFFTVGFACLLCKHLAEGIVGLSRKEIFRIDTVCIPAAARLAQAIPIASRR